MVGLTRQGKDSGPGGVPVVGRRRLYVETRYLGFNEIGKTCVPGRPRADKDTFRTRDPSWGWEVR